MFRFEYLTNNKQNYVRKRRIYLPPLSLVGPGVVNDLVDEIKSEKYRSVLVVSDPVLTEIGVVTKKLEEIDIT